MEANASGRKSRERRERRKVRGKIITIGRAGWRLTQKDGVSSNFM